MWANQIVKWRSIEEPTESGINWSQINDDRRDVMTGGEVMKQMMTYDI